MDIITNKNVAAPQVMRPEFRQAEPAPVGRTAAPVDAPVDAPATQMLSKSEEAAQQPDKQTVEDALTSIQESTQAMQRNLNFSIDDSTGRMVVKVTDSKSGDVIRQMPTEDALRLAESLDEMRSLLFKAQA